MRIRMDDGDEPKGLAGEPRGENIPLVVGEGPDKEVEQTRAKRQGEEPEFETIDEQVAYYERKVRTCHKAKDKAAEGEALCNLGILFYKTAKFSDAKCCHERHLALAKACQEPRAIRRAYCNLGCSFRRIGHLDRARECYEEGLKIAEELGDCAGEAKLLNNLGNILEEEGDLDKAIYYHQRRMKVAKTVNDLDGESKACASIGNIYHLLGNIRQSIAFYERLVSCLKYKLGELNDCSRNVAASETQGRIVGRRGNWGVRTNDGRVSHPPTCRVSEDGNVVEFGVIIYRHRGNTLSVLCGHLDFESAVTARADKFREVLIARLHIR